MAFNSALFYDLEPPVPKHSEIELKAAFDAFLAQNDTYKNQYRQSHFNCAFDGYSFLGQTDSLNQYSYDLLYSFVVSNFSDIDAFPKEFRAFLKDTWSPTIQIVKDIEQRVIDQLDLPGLASFYESYIGHMVSCNYYPAIDQTKLKEPLRLSKHVDVSLFTIFVYGASEGFSYEDHQGHIKPLYITDRCVVFPGYLLEYLTKGAHKALAHQVELLEMQQARYAFAFFSIPKPHAKLKFNDMTFESTTYYQHYLDLF